MLRLLLLWSSDAITDSRGLLPVADRLAAVRCACNADMLGSRGVRALTAMGLCVLLLRWTASSARAPTLVDRCCIRQRCGNRSAGGSGSLALHRHTPILHDVRCEGLICTDRRSCGRTGSSYLAGVSIDGSSNNEMRRLRPHAASLLHCCRLCRLRQDRRHNPAGGERRPALNAEPPARHLERG